MSRATYYSYVGRTESKRSLENKELRVKILTIYGGSKKRFGAYKIRERLKAEYGIDISVGRVYRLMKDMNLPKMSTIKPNKANKKSEDTEDYENHIRQNFKTDAPNIAWVSDITYIKTNKGFVYLCGIIDLYSRRVIAFETSTRNDTNLTKSTFLKAYKARKPKPNTLFFHSDRGSNYTAKEFRKLLDKCDITMSFSAKGYPYDNAVMESFFKYLKLEEINRKSFKDINDVNDSLCEYMTFYNYKRPHSANDGKTPVEKENAVNL